MGTLKLLHVCSGVVNCTWNIVATLGQAQMATIAVFRGVEGQWGVQKCNINRYIISNMIKAVTRL